MHAALAGLDEAIVGLHGENEYEESKSVRDLLLSAMTAGLVMQPRPY